MINRTKEIQRIIDENGYESYCEIGLGSGGNFNAIKCKEKVGIDPEVKLGSNTFNMTSDEFFEKNDKTFSICFIDGLHHCEQVELDLVNCWNALEKGGQIILHDCNPPDEISQIVPRKQSFWCGDVWKTVFSFIDKYGEKIEHELIKERVGLFVIYKKNSKIKLKQGFLNKEYDWNYFVENKKKYYKNL